MSIPGIPKSEKSMTKRLDNKGNVYYITTNATRESYFLYKIENNKAIKLGKASTPTELEKKYIK